MVGNNLWTADKGFPDYDLGVSGLRFRTRTFDWLLVFSCLAAIGVYLIRGFDGYLSRDLALYSYGGQRVADGVAPYIGVFDRGGPLAQFLPGLGVVFARIVSLDDVLGVRVVFLAFAVASVGLVYLIGRDLFESRQTGVIAASVMLSFHGFTHFAANGPRPQTVMVAFVLAALLALTHQRWILVGIFVSLATLTWQPAFVAGVAAIFPAVFIGLEKRGRPRALFQSAIGGLVPLGFVVGGYVAIGRLGAFLDGFVLANLKYTVATPIFDRFGLNLVLLKDGYGLSAFLLLLGLAAIWALSYVALREENLVSRKRASLIAIGSFTLAAMAWTVFIDFDSYPDAFILLPGAALGVGAVVAQAAAHGLVPKLAEITVVAAVAIAIVYPVRNPASGLQEQKAAVDAFLAATPNSATILSVHAPQPLVLANRENPSEYQLFAYGADEYVNEVWPGGIEGYAQWVERHAPVVAVGAGAVPSWLTETLDTNYWRAEGPQGWDWYIHRDLGEDQLQAVEEAVSSSD